MSHKLPYWLLYSCVACAFWLFPSWELHGVLLAACHFIFDNNLNKNFPITVISVPLISVVGQLLFKVWLIIGTYYEAPLKSWHTGAVVLYVVIIRPPGTVVLDRLLFCCRCFYLFILPRELQTPFADCRETLPHDRKLGALYNASPKMRGAHPPKIGGQKHAKFRAIFYNFRIWWRISPERLKISKIGKTCDVERFLPRSKKKARWTLVD